MEHTQQPISDSIQLTNGVHAPFSYPERINTMQQQDTQITQSTQQNNTATAAAATISIEDITIPGSVVNEALETTKKAAEMRSAAVTTLLKLREQVEMDLKILGYDEPVVVSTPRVRMTQVSPHASPHASPRPTPTPTPAPAQSKRFRDYTLVQAVRELLTEAGGPLHGKDIEQKVRAGGIKTSMANFQSYLPTSLKRAGGFENTGRNWWVLNEKVKPVRP